jgi:hypothetical protein
MHVFWTCLRQFLSKKEDVKPLTFMEKFLSGMDPRGRRMLPTAHTTDQLCHRHGSDLAIGGKSLSGLSNAVVNQRDHPLFHRESQPLGGS